jgi:hypothetical protein
MGKDTKESIEQAEKDILRRKAELELPRYERIVALFDEIDQSPQMVEMLALIKELPSSQTLGHVASFAQGFSASRQQAIMMIPALKERLGIIDAKAQQVGPGGVRIGNAVN